jgi:hypothetical protein
MPNLVFGIARYARYEGLSLYALCWFDKPDMPEYGSRMMV